MLNQKEVLDDFKKLGNDAKKKYTLEYYIQKEAEQKMKMRGYYLQKKYKTSLDDYADLMKKQHGACAICQKTVFSKRLAVDHDHVTGKNRGLLCIRCNAGLGYFLDDKKILLAAISYIKSFEKEGVIVPESSPFYVNPSQNLDNSTKSTPNA